jgi:chemotaxis-related protein WspD
VNDPRADATPLVLSDLPVARTGAAPPVAVHDCWNQIGVEGNHTCRELARHIHCHNCPIYSAAAAQFLDRPLTPECRREWTEHYAREKRVATPAKISAVIYRLGAEWLALPTLAFQEIAERRAMHSLPHRRRAIVLGIVNVRGELLICASLGRLLGLEAPGPKKRARAVFDRLLVADWNGQRFAFPVDEVHGVHRFHQDDLREPPATLARADVHCTRAVFPWRGFTVGLLDCDALFATLNRNLS